MRGCFHWDALEPLFLFYKAIGANQYYKIGNIDESLIKHTACNLGSYEFL